MEDLVRARDLTARLTGLSTPLVGAQWQPRPGETDLARRVVTLLEDRRVLYAPDEFDVPRHCVESVLEIRRRVSDVLEEAAGRDPLTGNLRAIRAACRGFLDRVGDDVARELVRPERGGTPEWVFNQSLGELALSRQAGPTCQR